MRDTLTSWIAVAALAWAGSAAGAPTAPRLDLSRLQPAYAPGPAARPEGLAQTAVERRFARTQASAALGFLCGRQPSAMTSGGAAAYGVDPRGRFLGAQLRLPFR
jgi:hypothetical protein